MECDSDVWYRVQLICPSTRGRSNDAYLEHSLRRSGASCGRQASVLRQPTGVSYPDHT